ncbi:MAG: Rieske (2Fe-2S) protein [Mycobacterium sp.]
MGGGPAIDDSGCAAGAAGLTLDVLPDKPSGSQPMERSAMDIDKMQVSRKSVIVGAGVGLAAAALAACSGGSDSGSGESGGQPSGEAPEETAGAGTEQLATTAEVPVGSGVIVGETIITQPVAGDFKAFSAVCTHSGCLIDEVADGTINCPCHGSKFSLDGAVVNGPAARPLTEETITVQGESIVAG